MSRPRSRLTLFVRNLPYSTTDEELTAVFGHYGTLKRCFTVKEKTVSDRCRGFGYVTFQERESADSAVKHVKTVGSRPVQVTYAERRPSTKRGESSKSHKSLTTKDEDDSSSSSDYEERTDNSIQLKVKAQRTSPEYAIGKIVVLTGLPEKATAKSIRIRCRKLGPVEAIQYPVPGRGSLTALVTYQLHKDARIAVNQLTGKTFGGCTLSAVLLSKETKSMSAKSLKKCRIVVRNLSFKSSDEDVQAIFTAHGKVLDVTIPRKPNGHMLGYAFVQFSSFFEAKKAIDAVNGTEVNGRVINVGWLVQRDKYKKEKEEDKKKDQENDKADENEGQKASVVDDDEEISEDKGISNDDDDDDDAEEDEEDNDDASNDESNDMESVVSDESTGKREDVTEGRTLFVRNVAADADDEQLETIFKQFGRVEYCKAVINPDTGVCKGSAFVKFSDVSGVQACMLAEGDPNTKGLWFDGRRLNISLALSKKELSLMKQKMDDQSANEAKQDKRNLYLAHEGVIIPGSDLAKELSKSDMAKRAKSHQERKRKLKNPYFFVSRTRLSVRNLPVSVNESQLKKLFTKHAGRGTIFKQVKIMRSKERFTAEGLGRSLGFGFVELADHDTALTALRAINNNPAIFGSEQRPIVEFALEDSRALKLREERKARSLATHGKVTKDEESKSVKPDNKRVEWQLKWKERRLKRKTRDKQSHPVQTKTVAQGNKSAKPTVSLRHNKVSSRAPVTTKHRPAVQSTGVKRGRADDCVYQNAKKKYRQKVSRSQGEERAFDDLVKKYKDKLVTNSMADSRWYE